MSFFARFFGRSEQEQDADPDLEGALEQIQEEDAGLFMGGTEGVVAGEEALGSAEQQPVTFHNESAPSDQFAPAEPSAEADEQPAHAGEAEAEVTEPQAVDAAPAPEPDATLEEADEGADHPLPTPEAAEESDEEAGDPAGETGVQQVDAGGESSDGGDGEDDDPLAAFRSTEKKSLAGKLLEGREEVSVHELLETAQEVRSMLPGGKNEATERAVE